jgi:hypothetical protein
MTALAEQLTANGIFPSVTVADLAISAGQAYRDGNGQVRCAGSPVAVQADVRAASQVAGLVLMTTPPHRGNGANKW